MRSLLRSMESAVSRLDRIAVRQLDGRREHLVETQRAELGEHRHDPAGRARRHRGERPVLGRVLHPVRLEELRRRAGRRHAERVDADDLAGVRVVDQRLRLAAPGQRVPHRGGRGDHGAGRIDRVAALLEDDRAGGGRQRLAGDRHPMRPCSGGFCVRA